VKNSLNIFRKWFAKNRLGIPKFFVCLLIVSLIVQTFPLIAIAAPGTPNIISYQGRLTDASGNLLGGSGTTYYFKFSIWDNETVGNGTRLWPSAAPTSLSKTVRQGVFNVNIGDTAAGYPDTLDHDFSANDSVFLQIEVSSNNSTFETLGPRQRITAAAFAKTAGSVAQLAQVLEQPQRSVIQRSASQQVLQTQQHFQSKHMQVRPQIFLAS
jgi:hypothetical protein